VVIVAVGDLRLGEAQPHEPVIGAVGDRPLQILDRPRIALVLVFGLGIATQLGNEVGLALFGIDPAEQVVPVIFPGIGQLFRLVFGGSGRCGPGCEDEDENQRQSAEHRFPPIERTPTKARQASIR
jgi:hypothetical protein